MLDYHLPHCLMIAYNNFWLTNDELELAKKRGIVNWGYEIEDLQQLKDIKAAFQFADALKMLKEAAKNNTQGWKNKIGNFRN